MRTIVVAFRMPGRGHGQTCPASREDDRRPVRARVSQMLHNIPGRRWCSRIDSTGDGRTTLPHRPLIARRRSFPAARLPHDPRTARRAHGVIGWRCCGSAPQGNEPERSISVRSASARHQRAFAGNPKATRRFGGEQLDDPFDRQPTLMASAIEQDGERRLDARDAAPRGHGHLPSSRFRWRVVRRHYVDVAGAKPPTDARSRRRAGGGARLRHAPSRSRSSSVKLTGSARRFRSTRSRRAPALESQRHALSRAHVNEVKAGAGLTGKNSAR